MEFAIQDYIKPELIILVPVLYFLGVALKGSRLHNCLIPFILGGVGMALAALWVFSTGDFSECKSVPGAVFVAVTQGLLTAAAAVYIENLGRQGAELRSIRKTEKEKHAGTKP